MRRGDTLGAIARKTGTTIAQLKNWNKLRTTNLQVGDQAADSVAAPPGQLTRQRIAVAEPAVP